MARKRHTAEEIVAKLRQVDVLMSQGRPVAEAVRSIGVTEVTYYRWRQEYGGLKGDQVKRLKELEAENARLRRAVSDLTLDKMILAEASRGTSLFGLHDASPILTIPPCVSDFPARLLLLSEIGSWPSHDGIRRSRWSHLSRAIAWAPHEFPRSHLIRRPRRTPPPRVEEVGWNALPVLCNCGPAELGLIAPHAVEHNR